MEKVDFDAQPTISRRFLCELNGSDKIELASDFSYFKRIDHVVLGLLGKERVNFIKFAVFLLKINLGCLILVDRCLELLFT